MPRGRKAKVKGGIGGDAGRILRMRQSERGSGYECCSGGKHNKIILVGLMLIALGFLMRVGWSISDLLLLIGAIFIVKGLLLSSMKK